MHCRLHCIAGLFFIQQKLYVIRIKEEATYAEILSLPVSSCKGKTKATAIRLIIIFTTA